MHISEHIYVLSRSVLFWIIDEVQQDINLRVIIFLIIKNLSFDHPKTSVSITKSIINKNKRNKVFEVE